MSTKAGKASILLTDFGMLRLGVVTPELRVADVDFNLQQIRQVAETAIQQQCH